MHKTCCFDLDFFLTFLQRSHKTCTINGGYIMGGSRGRGSGPPFLSPAMAKSLGGGGDIKMLGVRLCVCVRASQSLLAR